MYRIPHSNIAFANNWKHSVPQFIIQGNNIVHIIDIVHIKIKKLYKWWNQRDSIAWFACTYMTQVQSPKRYMVPQYLLHVIVKCRAKDNPPKTHKIIRQCISLSLLSPGDYLVMKNTLEWYLKQLFLRLMSAVINCSATFFWTD